jgi:hypothetical protein
MKKRLRLEENAQILFFKTLKREYPALRKLTFAIPNGGYRTPTEAKRLQASGVTPGIPDIQSVFAAKGYHGLFIEMKKPHIQGQSKAVTTPLQKEKILLFREQGYMVEVCYGFEEAYKCLLDYWNRGPW